MVYRQNEYVMGVIIFPHQSDFSQLSNFGQVWLFKNMILKISFLRASLNKPPISRIPRAAKADQNVELWNASNPWKEKGRQSPLTQSMCITDLTKVQLWTLHSLGKKQKIRFTFTRVEQELAILTGWGSLASNKQKSFWNKWHTPVFL